MTFIGTDGSITVEQGPDTVRKRGAAPRPVEVTSDAPAGLLQQQVGRDLDIGTYRQAVAFLDSVRTGRKPVCDGQVGREVIHISLLGEKFRARAGASWPGMSSKREAANTSLLRERTDAGSRARWSARRIELHFE